MMQIADLRRDYVQSGLRRADLLPDPVAQFEKWFQEAVQAQVLEPNAMTLATVDPDGSPSARVVLLKGVDSRGFSFFTNYQSRKGQQLMANPHAALVFQWRELERQVCISGSAQKLSREESESYFKSRPLASQIGAWSSNQSRVIPNRAALEESWRDREKEFANREVPLPPHWGGFVIAPIRIEFWQGRPSRLHDRFLYTRETDRSWRIDRLSP